METEAKNKTEAKNTNQTISNIESLIDNFSKKIFNAPLCSANKSKKEQVQRVRGKEYKGLLKNLPDRANNTKTNIVGVAAAEVVVAIRGTAVSRIADPRTAPQHDLS
jgi:hypothetical protein